MEKRILLFAVTILVVMFFMNANYEGRAVEDVGEEELKSEEATDVDQASGSSQQLTVIPPQVAITPIYTSYVGYIFQTYGAPSSSAISALKLARFDSGSAAPTIQILDTTQYAYGFGDLEMTKDNQNNIYILVLKRNLFYIGTSPSVPIINASGGSSVNEVVQYIPELVLKKLSATSTTPTSETIPSPQNGYINFPFTGFLGGIPFAPSHKRMRIAYDTFANKIVVLTFNANGDLILNSKGIGGWGFWNVVVQNPGTPYGSIYDFDLSVNQMNGDTYIVYTEDTISGGVSIGPQKLNLIVITTSGVISTYPVTTLPVPSIAFGPWAQFGSIDIAVDQNDVHIVYAVDGFFNPIGVYYTHLSDIQTGNPPIPIDTGECITNPPTPMCKKYLAQIGTINLIPFVISSQASFPFNLNWYLNLNYISSNTPSPTINLFTAFVSPIFVSASQKANVVNIGIQKLIILYGSPSYGTIEEFIFDITNPATPLNSFQIESSQLTNGDFLDVETEII